MEAGTIDDDNIRHSTKVAWRALANLQKELELNGEAPLSKYNKIEPVDQYNGKCMTGGLGSGAIG